MRLKSGQPQVLITVRVSRDDALYVRQAAGRAGFKTISDYLRHLIGLDIERQQKALEFFGIQIGEKHNG